MRRTTSVASRWGAAVVLSRNSGKTIAGRVRFVADGEAWREAGFDLRIVEPPKPMVCG